MPELDRWERIHRSEAYRALIARKTRFVVTATLFFLVYYFALPVLVGYAPEFVKQRVAGVVNIAYLFAFSQFFMAWILAYLYMRTAARFDRETEEILNETGGGNE